MDTRPDSTSSRKKRLIGRDLLDELDARIPNDSSKQTLADRYIQLAPEFVNCEDPRILDLGCGAVASKRAFEAILPSSRWVGVDLVDSSEAAERGVRPGESFVPFNGTDIPFSDSSIDFAFCKQVLEHVREPRPLLTDLHRVLSDGAYFAGSTSQLEPFHSKSVGNWTPYGLTRLLEDIGFTVIELRPGIDAFTLLLRRALGQPRYFDRFWGRETIPNQLISLFGRLRRVDHQAINTAKLVFAGQFSFLAVKRTK